MKAYRCGQLSAECASHFLDLDEAGVARFAVGIATRDDDAVALLEGEDILGDLLRGVEKDVGRGELLAHSGDDAPGEGEPTPGFLVGRQTDDRHG